jgi:hypothetical protein
VNQEGRKAGIAERIATAAPLLLSAIRGFESPAVASHPLRLALKFKTSYRRPPRTFPAAIFHALAFESPASPSADSRSGGVNAPDEVHSFPARGEAWEAFPVLVYACARICDKLH